jgi:hypothetical protein
MPFKGISCFMARALYEKKKRPPRNKIAGRACYNTAIINEINGNLDQAVTWAQKAYEEHGTKLALQYLKALKDRRYQANRLKSQEAQ